MKSRDSNSAVLFLIPILLLGAVLRCHGLNWDGGIGAHPDERYVVGTAEGLLLAYEGRGGAGLPRRSDALNPFRIAPDFAYGHVPLYLLACVAGLLRGLDPLLVGRMLAVVFDIGTVTLTFALGRRVYGEGVGALAAAFVALTVLHVQQAHFYTVDVPLCFFVVGALLFGSRLAEGGRPRDAWLAGAWAGLALGTKVGAALLALPLGAACALAPVSPGARRRCALASGTAAGAMFALTNPFAWLALPTFWRNVAQQAAIVRGGLDVPYTRQFHATWPYLYPVVQQMRWGMGWPLGVLAFGGLAAAVWRGIRWPPRGAEWVLLAWVVPLFAFTGALYAKFPRYLLPLSPVLALYAARLLWALRRHGRRLACLFGGLVLLCSLLYCLAFAGIHRARHPWLAASEWLYDHAEPRAVIAVEQWDHPLPLDAAGYVVRELPVFEEDLAEKWAMMDEVLSEADYVIIASRRGYATLARWAERYPLTARYYRRLFGGELGFHPVACFGRFPSVGRLVLADDPTRGLDFSLPELCRPEVLASVGVQTAEPPTSVQTAEPPTDVQTARNVVLPLGRLDESFVVYDHPRVVILRRRGEGR